MKITNTSKQNVAVSLLEETNKFDGRSYFGDNRKIVACAIVHPGESVEGDVVNLPRIRKQVRVE